MLTSGRDAGDAAVTGGILSTLSVYCPGGTARNMKAPLVVVAKEGRNSKIAMRGLPRPLNCLYVVNSAESRCFFPPTRVSGYFLRNSFTGGAL